LRLALTTIMIASAMNVSPKDGNIPRRHTLLLVIALLCSILLTACSSAPPAVGEAFAARATAVCQKAIESKQAWSAFPVSGFDPAHPDPSAFPKTAVWLEDQVAPTFETWLNDLRALGEPPTGKTPWSDVLTAVEKIVQGNADEAAAANAGDTDAFLAAHDALIETQTELERATAAAGVPTCADVHKK
jgi:hypothetical protein